MYKLPTNCPSCDSLLEWSDTGTDLYCRNKMCQSQNTRMLLHFFQTLNNLDGFGPKTIEHLIYNGFDTIPKIYGMKYIDFQDCGYKTKTIMNLGTELEESIERELPDYRFIAALGIPDLGISGAKKVLEHFNYEEILFSMKPYDLINIDGFASKKCDSIFNYLEDNIELISRIFNIGFNITHEEISVKESPITNKRLTFTGKMLNNRTEMQNNAKELGAIITGVNSKSDYLICGKNVGQNKIDAANKHNVQILTESEYFALINTLQQI